MTIETMEQGSKPQTPILHIGDRFEVDGYIWQVESIDIEMERPDYSVGLDGGAGMTADFTCVGEVVPQPAKQVLYGINEDRTLGEVAPDAWGMGEKSEERT